MTYSGPIVFITLLIISAFCPLPDSDVGLSILVCDIGHTSAHFGLCGRKFVMCLFGQRQMLWDRRYRSWKIH